MTQKDSAVDQAPQEEQSLTHLDDFLNAKHDAIKGSTGEAHVESLTAFAKAKKSLNHVWKTEEQWHEDFEAWLNEEPK